MDIRHAALSGKMVYGMALFCDDVMSFPHRSMSLCHAIFTFQLVESGTVDCCLANAARKLPWAAR